MNNMKKSVIAAAVAAVLAAPVALADVSISGGLQAEVVSLSGDGAVEGLYAADGVENDTVDSGNYGFLKFAASEDLGDGMKALAVYNMNTHVDAGAVAARDAFVGLSGGFGTVLAGTLNTPYKSSTVGWDPMLATAMQARGSNGMSTFHNGYVSNALAYANNFGGVKLVAAIVLDETPDAADPTKTYGNHASSISVNAPVGPVEVAVAYISLDEFGGGAADNSATKAGVKWVSGDITVAGQYEMLNGVSADPTFLYVTGSYKMGNNTISASYGMNDLDVDGSDDQTYMAVAFNHAFSKNTNAFVGYRASDNDGDTDTAALSAGLRVNF
jgi:predicted porin